MVYKSKQPMPVPEGTLPDIVITVRQEIGRVQHEPYGTKPMVVAAYEIAGEYLNEKASDGEPPATIEFEFGGVTFHAGYDR